jgi:SAM-dependent methyltransferase
MPMIQHAYSPWKPASRRSELLTHDISPATERGLEIGALDNPQLTREHSDVRYVDYTNTAGLRAHPHESSVNRERIVDVDYVWPGSGSLADAIGTGEQFDYVIASHVIEHVPNVLGWFQGIHEVLRPGGVFNLAIPDKRYTFDVGRTTSSLGELVEAYLLNYMHPSIRQNFDHTFGARAVGPGEAWQSNTGLANAPRYLGDVALRFAYDQAKEIVRCGRYFDSHCWVFTPLSFIELLEGAAEIGIFPFIVSDFWPTLAGDFEFFITLRRYERDVPSEELYAHQLWTIRVVKERAAEQQRRLALLVDRG